MEAGDRASRRSEVVLRGKDELGGAVEDLLTEAGLTAFLDDEDKLPVFMRARDGFGLNGESILPNQYQRWLTRAKRWTERVGALHEAGATESVATLELERTNVQSVPIFLIPQMCPMLHTLAMRSCWLSDGDISTFAICMRGQLRALDLSNSRGFRDLGVKSLAAFSVGLEELRLGGCEVSDQGIEKVALFCKKLKVLELTDSNAVSFLSLSHLPATCAVERLAPPPTDLLGNPPPGVTQARPVKPSSFTAERGRRAAIGPRTSQVTTTQPDTEAEPELAARTSAAGRKSNVNAEAPNSAESPSAGSPTAKGPEEANKQRSWLSPLVKSTFRRGRRKSAIDRYWDDDAQDGAVTA